MRRDRRNSVQWVLKLKKTRKERRKESAVVLRKCTLLLTCASPHCSIPSTADTVWSYGLWETVATFYIFGCCYCNKRQARIVVENGAHLLQLRFSCQYQSRSIPRKCGDFIIVCYLLHNLTIKGTCLCWRKQYTFPCVHWWHQSSNG